MKSPRDLLLDNEYTHKQNVILSERVKQLEKKCENLEWEYEALIKLV